MVKDSQVLASSSSSHHHHQESHHHGHHHHHHHHAPPPRDRTLECAVCGKLFSRGHLDLTRHMNAITLQHLFIRSETNHNHNHNNSINNPNPLNALFPFQCSYCKICFQNQEHFLLHSSQTTCGKSNGTKRIKSFHEDLTTTESITNINHQNPSEDKNDDQLLLLPINSEGIDSSAMNAEQSSSTAVPEEITSNENAVSNDAVESMNEEVSTRIISNLHEEPSKIIPPAVFSSEVTSNQGSVEAEAEAEVETEIQDSEKIDNIGDENEEKNFHLTEQREIITSNSPPKSFDEVTAVQSVEMDITPNADLGSISPIADNLPPTNINFTPAVSQPLLPENVIDENHQMIISPKNNDAQVLDPSTSSTDAISDGFPSINGGHTSLHKRHDVKTMECMVCGKLFPRGPIDLQRHATAITLKHLIAKRKSASFNHCCTRCNLCFTSLEHLQMHENYSTCNPNLVWPYHAESMSGLRAIPRTQLEKIKIPPPPPITTPTNSLITPTTGSNSQRKSFTFLNSNNSPYMSKRKDSFSISQRIGNEDFIFTPLTGSGRATRANSYVENNNNSSSSSAVNGVNSSSVATTTVALGSANNNNTTATATTTVNGGTSSKKRKQVMTIDYENIKQKHARYILPEERKAYFAIISLLIDPSSINPMEVITEENYESFVPAEHHSLVERLKSVLQYTV